MRSSKEHVPLNEFDPFDLSEIESSEAEIAERYFSTRHKWS